jgi:hypothetical protein
VLFGELSIFLRVEVKKSLAAVSYQFADARVDDVVGRIDGNAVCVD